MRCGWVTAVVSPSCLLWGHFALELRQWKRPKAYIIAKARQTICNRRIVGMIDGQAKAQVAMNTDTIQSLLYLYGFVAVVASICVASSLEERLKSRLPATRPYRWGFYNGCMGVACAPLALLFLVAMVASAMAGKGEVFGSSLVYSVWLAACALCGWFIIQRKRWAWGLGTVLSFNILVWIINYIYGRNRWGEFVGGSYNSAEDEGYELLHDATKLEAGGRAQEALTLYQRIVERYPNTAAAGDARISAESLRDRLGLACPAPVEAATAPPLPPRQDAGRHPGCLSPVRADGSGPNLEPELMAALAAKGADILECGICDFEPWCAKLLANLGETIASKARPDLCQVYNAAQEEVRKRQGRLQTAESAPVSPAVSVGTQADSDTGQARPVAVAKLATGVPRWRMRSLATGLAVVVVVALGLTAVWIWPDRKLARAKPRELTDAEVGLVPDRRDESQARPELTDAQAQYELGERYWNGDGVPLDLDEAARWYRKAADQGLDLAQYSLGICYYYGKGVQQDYGEAAKWLRKAADQGDAGAQNDLAVCYQQGQGVPNDGEQAAFWYRKAADQGLALAQFNLGRCYGLGLGVKKDMREAARWLLPAANAGIAPAQFILGVIYRSGQGVPLNYAEAARWFQAASQQGLDDAQIELGKLYATGRGVPKHDYKAAEMFRKAADQGNATAQYLLGADYWFGWGVAKDIIEALKWFDLSAAQGHREAQEKRESLVRAENMTAQQVWEARCRVAAFVPKKEGGGGGSGDISPTPRVGEGKMFVGSGFFVTDDGYFVTCEHVVRGATSFHVRSPSGSLPARLIKKDRTIDVAVLKVDGAFQALPVAAQPRVKLGEAVFTIGFPNPVVQGVEPKLTRGDISSMAGVQDNPRYYQISVPVQPGNSGGALLDECGNAVGVVTSRLDDVATYQESGALPQNVNYAVKGGVVYNFLSGVPELSGKLKAPRTRKDREAASGAAERAAVLVVAGSSPKGEPAGVISGGPELPNPIHVSRAATWCDKGTTKVVIELRDVNYPGSTYTLELNAQTDQLFGQYYQTALQQTYEVVFSRVK
jgi:TPR repeat protein